MDGHRRRSSSWRSMAAAAVLTLIAIACGGSAADTSSAPQESTPQESAPQESAPQDQSKPGQSTGATAAAVPSAEEIATYSGADRDELLLEGAREQGTIRVYEGIGQEDMELLVAGFQEKYPDLEVEAYRAGGEEIRERILREYEAGVYNVDVMGVDFLGGEILEREGILQPYYTPLSEDLPEEFVAPDGLWNAYRVQYFVAGYNTNLISADEAPTELEDFLNPAWDGGFATEAASYDWMTTLVTALGEEEGTRYFEELSQQDPDVRQGYSTLTELLSAGEVAVAFPVYNHAVQQMKDDGAPVDWVAIEPVVASPSKLVIPAQSQNPYGALLWIDFMLSEDGQSILRDRNRVPTNPSVPADPPSMGSGFEFVVMDAEAIVDEPERWRTQFDTLFLR